MTIAHDGDAGSSVPYASWAGWYLLVIMEIQCLLQGVDVGIVTLLVRPIETSFRIDDVLFATITATPIALGIGIMYYPAGLFADAFRRRDIVTWGTLAWTLSAGISASAHSPTMLFLARLVAGIGIGIAIPAMASLLMDSFPPSRRGLVFGAWNCGLSIGGGLSLVMCSALVAALANAGPRHLLGMTFAPWQQCFVAAAVLGMVSTVLAATVREPARQDLLDVRSEGLTSTFVAFWKYLRRGAVLWVVLLMAFSIVQTGADAIGAWAPTLAARRYGEGGPGAISLLGTVTAAASLAGSLFFGFLAQYVVNTGQGKTLPIILAAASVAMAIPLFAFPYLPTWLLAVAGIGAVMMVLPIFNVLFFLSLNEASPNRVRGQLIGVFGIFYILPQVAGPTLTAFLAEHAFLQNGGFVPALALIGGGASLLGAVFFVFCSLPFSDAVDRLHAGAAADIPAGGC